MGIVTVLNRWNFFFAFIGINYAVGLLYNGTCVGTCWLVVFVFLHLCRQGQLFRMARKESAWPTAVLPVLALYFCASRLQLSDVHLCSLRHIHHSSFFDRLSTSIRIVGGTPAKSASEDEREADRSRYATDSSGSCSSADRGTHRAAGGERGEGKQKEKAKRRRPTNRASRCIDQIEGLHECLRTRETRACASLADALKACVKTHTGENEDAWEWTRTRYGKMTVPVMDLYIGISLMLYGEWAEEEARLFARLLRHGDTAVDAGAHIGSLSLALSSSVGKFRIGDQGEVGAAFNTPSAGSLAQAC